MPNLSCKAIKEFKMFCGSTDNMYYLIRVLHKGTEVDRFLAPTMRESWDLFHAAGYSEVSEVVNA